MFFETVNKFSEKFFDFSENCDILYIVHKTETLCKKIGYPGNIYRGGIYGNLIRWNVYARPELLVVGRDSRVTR